MQDKQYIKKQHFEENVDLWRYAKALYKRIWAIILATVVFATGTFLFSATIITPTYRSGFITYVNNKLELSTGGNTTVSDLNASYALAYTYESIITSRSVIEDAVAICRRNGTYPEGENVSYKVSTSVAEKAPVISVYVEAADAVFAYDLAVAIAQAAPNHVERVVEGSSMRIIDEATLPGKPSGPNNLRNAAMGGLIGAVLACAVVIMLEFLMDKVQSVDDLEKRYDVPVLGAIPDINHAKKQAARKSGMGKGGRR